MQELSASTNRIILSKTIMIMLHMVLNNKKNFVQPISGAISIEALRLRGVRLDFQLGLASYYFHNPFSSPMQVFILHKHHPKPVQ